MSATITPRLRMTIDGSPVNVAAGTTVAAAIASLPAPVTRRSATNQARGPLCGMGVCFECRVEIDGSPHVRSCMVLCRDGMVIRTMP